MSEKRFERWNDHSCKVKDNQEDILLSWEDVVKKLNEQQAIINELRSIINHCERKTGSGKKMNEQSMKDIINFSEVTDKKIERDDEMSEIKFSKSNDGQIQQNGLIMSTDEVIDYLNTCNNVIAKLRKENKRLNERNDELEDELEESSAFIIEQREENKQLKKAEKINMEYAEIVEENQKLRIAKNDLRMKNEQLQKTIDEVMGLLVEEVDLFSDKAIEHDIIAYKEMNQFDNKDAYYMCISTKKAIKMLQRCLDE